MSKTVRNSKDTIFRMIFKEPENALALYNAINYTDYEDYNQLEITTLENAIYISYKNDVSFILNSDLCLYEHQSTINPNIPLRTLFYISAQLSKLTDKENLYGRKLVKISTPRFICFYNGVATFPEYEEWKLSDAFKNTSGKIQLELIVDVYNINKGKNVALLKACKILGDYAIYVEKVRTYSKIMSIEDAVNKAIAECISDDILAEFLRKNQVEAKSMTIFEYDEEQHIRLEREDAKAEGKIEGKIEGRIEGKIEGKIYKLAEIIRKNLEQGIDSSVIADFLDVELSCIENIENMISHNPDITDLEIAEQLLQLEKNNNITTFEIL